MLIPVHVPVLTTESFRAVCRYYAMSLALAVRMKLPRVEIEESLTVLNRMHASGMGASVIRHPTAFAYTLWYEALVQDLSLAIRSAARAEAAGSVTTSAMATNKRGSRVAKILTAMKEPATVAKRVRKAYPCYEGRVRVIDAAAKFWKHVGNGGKDRGSAFARARVELLEAMDVCVTTRAHFDACFGLGCYLDLHRASLLRGHQAATNVGAKKSKKKARGARKGGAGSGDPQEADTALVAVSELNGRFSKRRSESNATVLSNSVAFAGRIRTRKVAHLSLFQALLS